MITSRERDLAQQLEPGQDHPVLPEADDLARGRVDVAGVVALELGRLLRPAERRERPERRREPGVEDVRVALDLGRAALGAGVGRRPGAVTWPSGQYQSGSWCPHQSWREMFQSGISSSESDRELVLRLGVVPHTPLAQRLERGLAQLLHRHPPLERDERLDPRVAALARADRSAGSAPASRAGRAPSARRESRSSASSCVSPASSPAFSFIRPSRPITVIGRAGRGRGRSRSPSGRGPGVTLSAPVPNSGSTRSSAITGTRALDVRDDRLLADERRGSARRRDAPRRRRRRASSPDGRSRS